MKARSLVFDLFGDYLRYRGGEVRLQALVALLGCFDVPETTVRVVVGRLRKEGWLASERHGRETTYLLTEAAWQLLDEGRARIFTREEGPWDGQWHIVTYSVPESSRTDRERLRRTLAWAGFGPLSAGLWLSPRDRLAAVQARFGERPGVRLDTFRARSAGPRSDRDLAARAWDVESLHRDYDDMLTAYRPRLEAYRGGEVTGHDALVERMQLVHDYRLFPFRDPDLPPELLPDGWPGHAAHEVFLEAHRLLRTPAEAAVDECLASGALRELDVCRNAPDRRESVVP